MCMFRRVIAPISSHGKLAVQHQPLLSSTALSASSSGSFQLLHPSRQDAAVLLPPRRHTPVVQMLPQCLFRTCIPLVGGGLGVFLGT
eukprot:3187950-Amphidinium_carterae.1